MFAAVVISSLVTLIVLFLRFRRYSLLRREIVHDYEQALLYDKGRLRKTLQAGAYWVWPSQTLHRVDTRAQLLSLGAQEILTADGLSLKLSLTGTYRIVDAVRSVTAAVYPLNVLNLESARVLRTSVLALTLEQLLADRGTLDAALFAGVAPACPPIGFELLSLAVRDTILSGEMKRAMAAPVIAQRQGQAALERARGETAALRNLANAARLTEEQPSLLQLRALQSVEQGSSNTIVLGVGSSPLPVSIARREDS